MKELTAKQIFAQLIKQGAIEKKNIGKFEFSFLNLTYKEIDNNSVGSLFQNWLCLWFKENKIFYRTPANTQESPDFFLKKNDDQDGLLEIKTFYKSPDFDIKSWTAFLTAMIEKPYQIFSDYLIFHYNINSNGNEFSLENIYLKKIWEISRPMTEQSTVPFKINVQYKKGVIYNLRPLGTKDLQEKKSPYFKDHVEFLTAVQETIDMYQKSDDELKNNKWLELVKNNYKKITRKELF